MDLIKKVDIDRLDGASILLNIMFLHQWEDFS
jgi:hypothetical protein